MRSVARHTLTLSLALAVIPLEAVGQALAACAPRVEATAAVHPAVVARLTASLSPPDDVEAAPCPLVRLDMVGAHLVMTAVLDDGRQVARVLRSQADAVPTYVALLATPPLPPLPDDDDANEVTPPPAPSTTTAPAAPPAALPYVVVMPAPRVPAAQPAARAWQVRLGAAFGGGLALHHFQLHGGLDLDVLRPHWALGLRGLVDGERHGVGWGATFSLRWRSVGVRWEFDAGPAVGLRVPVDTERNGVALRAGVESALGYRLGGAWSVFARVEGGADISMREHGRAGTQTEPEADADLAWGATVGLRWEVLR